MTSPDRSVFRTNRPLLPLALCTRVAADCNLMSARRLAVSAALVSCLVAASCSNETPSIVTRAQSPDGAYDAVIARASGGATSPWDIRVYLIAHGTPTLRDRDQVFGATHVDALALTWRDSGTVVIHYRYANIYTFKNTWWDTRARILEVRLAPAAENSISPRDRSPAHLSYLSAAKSH